MATRIVRLTGTIDVPLDKLGAAAHHIDVHISLTRAEPGCLEFRVEPDETVKGRFRVSELFSDRKSFEAHQERVKNSEWGSFSQGFVRSYKVTEVES